MNNKIIKGLTQSALTVSLAFLSFTSATAIAASAPTDITLRVPITIEAGHDLVEVGGPGNFGVLAPAGASEADDGVAAINVSSVMDSGFNFYGTTYNAATQFHVSSNGHVNFGAGFASISPQIASWNQPTLPFFIVHQGDMSTNDQGAGAASTGGTSTGTNDVFYHLDAINDIVTITFDDVGKCCSPVATDTLTAAQLRFHNIGSGNFVVEYRYENVGWANGRLLGWSAGDLINFNQDFNTTDIETKSNINHPGVFAWTFINGQVIESYDSVLEGAANGTAVGALNTIDPDVGDTFTYELLDDADGRFILSDINNDGTIYVVVADGGNRLNANNNETHDITVRVTDSSAFTFDKTLTIDVIKVPVFLTTSNIVVPVNESLNLTIKTQVEQGTGIPTITAAGLPAWMSFADNGDGTVTLSGFPSFELTNRVTLTVTDNLDNVTSRTFNITVEEPQDKTETGTGSTTTTVTITEEGSDGGSFGWLSLVLLGSLLTRRKLN